MFAGSARADYLPRGLGIPPAGGRRGGEAGFGPSQLRVAISRREGSGVGGERLDVDALSISQTAPHHRECFTWEQFN